MKKLLFTVLLISLLSGCSLQQSNISDEENFGARTQGFWNNVGTRLEVTRDSGFNILIKGVSKYLNFGSFEGTTGYGLRDNSGTMNFKDSGESWDSFVGDTEADSTYLRLDTTNDPLTNSLTVGKGSIGVDYTLTFGGEDSSGVVTWLEDEDQLQFSDDLKIDQRTIFDSSNTSVTAGGGIPSNKTFVELSGSGGPITITANPQITAGVAQGQYLIIEGESDTNTVTIANGNGLHLHGGEATLGLKDMMTLHWDTADSEWHEITRNFSTTDKAWSFTSPAGSSGIFYFDGFYDFASTDNDFNPSVNFGTANAARGAHLLFVQAAGASGGIDTLVRITGTSITDTGVRTASDTQDITVDDAGAAGTYYESSKKWVGQVAIVKISGPDLLLNYGWTKYWDNNNNDFRAEGVNVTWLGGANDSSANLILRHHKATGWTYNASSTPTPPAAIVDMNTDYNTEINIINGENGAWKRTNLNTTINGSGSEGVIIEIVTSANKTFELGNFLLTIRPN